MTPIIAKIPYMIKLLMIARFSFCLIENYPAV